MKKRNSDDTPPLIAEKIFSIFYQNGEQSYIGDLREVFREYCQSNGFFYACMWYWIQVLKCAVYKTKHNQYWKSVMFKNNLKIFLRNISRNKFYSSINIAGLVVGISSVLLILAWADYELSYDGFHENGANIYRILTELEDEYGETQTIARTPAPLFAEIKGKIPEVINACRWSKDTRVPLKFKDNKFFEDGISSIDPDFLNMFSFSLIEGSMEDLFQDKRSVVITKRLAEKYFGKEDPIGKQLNWNNWQMYTVRGVIEDVPENSHINFDLLRTFEIEKDSWPGGFTWNNFNRYTYVQIEKSANLDIVTSKINDVLHQNNTWTKERNFRLVLQPLNSIHTKAGIGDEYAELMDILYIKIFLSIGIVILLLACINYINLSTARSIIRSKEIGIRKVVGAKRKEIITQFLTESVLTAIVAYLLSIISVIVFIPEFNYLTGKNIDLNFLDLTFFIISIIIILVTGVASGFYPSLLISSFNPVSILKSHKTPGSGGAKLRKILVVFQFAVSIGLVAGTVTIYQQLNFINNKNVGFEKDKLIYIQVKDNIGKEFDTARNEFLNSPYIDDVSIKLLLPTDTMEKATVHWKGKKPSEVVNMNLNSVNYNYFKTLGLEIVYGRGFTREFATDNAIILNEEAVKLAGLENPIGESFWVNNKRNTIIGVTKNANFKSLHYKITPEIFKFSDDRTSNEMNLSGVILIRVSGDNFLSAVNATEEVWNKINPDYPFEYRTLNDVYNKFYGAEKKMAILFNYFTVIAILISCLGLYGLTAFSTEQRSKEIGIRKILGANNFRIMYSFISDFAKWIILANILVWPLVWITMDNWLENFAYHIEPEIGTFLIIGLLSLLMGIITVSYNILKATAKNPVDTLRYE